MKPEDQRIAIAEALGFRNMRANNGIWFGTAKESQSEETWPLPDYLNDLNAMYEAEKLVLDDTQIDEYKHRLQAVITDRERISQCATAAQRAEAFLKCIGKWVD